MRGAFVGGGDEFDYGGWTTTSARARGGRRRGRDVRVCGPCCFEAEADELAAAGDAGPVVQFVWRGGAGGVRGVGLGALRGRRGRCGSGGGGGSGHGY